MADPHNTDPKTRTVYTDPAHNTTTVVTDRGSSMLPIVLVALLALAALAWFMSGRTTPVTDTNVTVTTPAPSTEPAPAPSATPAPAPAPAPAESAPAPAAPADGMSGMAAPTNP